MFGSKPARKGSGVRQHHDHIIGDPHHLTQGKLPVIQVLQDVAGKSATELLISKGQGLPFNIKLNEMGHTIESDIYIPQDFRLFGYYLRLESPMGTGTNVDYPFAIAQPLGVLEGCVFGYYHVHKVSSSAGAYETNDST